MSSINMKRKKRNVRQEGRRIEGKGNRKYGNVSFNERLLAVSVSQVGRVFCPRRSIPPLYSPLHLLLLCVCGGEGQA